MSIKESIVHGAKKLGRAISAKSPTILVIGGTVGLIAAGVIACKETRQKLDEVLAEHKQKVEALKDIRDGKIEIDSYTQEEYKGEYRKHLTHVYLSTICKLFKIYAPALILATLSTASILTGHKIITGRHLAAVAECYAVRETLSEYRKRVAGAIGDEAEKLLYLDGENVLITDEVVDPETGEVVKKSHEGLAGRHTKKMQYSYVASKDTMCSYAMFNSDADFRRFIGMRIREANEYISRHDQVILGDIMRHTWNDKFIREHGEIITDGWWRDNPLVGEQLPTDVPIEADIKLISEPGEERKYIVTFNCQGNIRDAFDAAKAKNRAKEKMRRKVSATVRPKAFA